MRAARRSRAPLVLFLAMLLPMLAGCASIPMSGPVQTGADSTEQRDDGVRYLPPGPASGATQEEIVEGFLNAGTGIQNDFATARQYLAPDVRTQWQPQARVLVTDGTVSTKSEGNNVTVTVSVFGEVDSAGVFTTFTRGETRTLDFHLQSDGSQWRITQAPEGVVLITQAFDDLFEPRTLYFYDSPMANTVPDLRWFLDDDRAVTNTVTALLGGPASWLQQGSVISAFPEGVSLVTDVDVHDDVATVNLSSAASTAATPAYLSYMYLQLQLTLHGMGKNITSVEMQVNGARLEVQVPPAGTVTITPNVNSKPLVATPNASLGYIGSDSSIEVPPGTDNVRAALAKYPPIRGAMSATNQSITFLTSDSKTYSMHFGDEQPTLVDARPAQIEPALDNWDWVWTQSTSERQLDVSHVGDPQRTTLDLPDGVGTDFTSHQVSRDGSRLAVLFNSPEGVKLAIMAIQRVDGKPVKLGLPMIADLAGTQASDLAWVEPTSVATLVGTSNGSVDVKVYRVGGQITPYSPVQQALQVAGSNSLSGMRIVDQWGTFYAARGTGWRSLEATVTFIYAQT